MIQKIVHYETHKVNTALELFSVVITFAFIGVHHSSGATHSMHSHHPSITPPNLNYTAGLMKSMIRFLILASLLLAGSIHLTAHAGEIVLYVSHTGNDSWSGTRRDQNQNQTDGPFASPAKCRDVLRSMIQGGKLLPPGATVYIRGGDYPLTETLSLTSIDAGTPEAPVVWRAYPGETVRLIGGKEVTRFKPVDDPGILGRLATDSRSHVRVADLRSQGINSYGEITPRGGPGMELFFKSGRMTVARWPNGGWLKIADVPQAGERRFNEGLAREKRYDNVPVGRHYGKISYDDPRPARWSGENEIFLHGYWTWDWSDSFQKVKSIDTLHHEITIAEPHHHYGYTKNQRYYILNVLEELDMPGEWYLDRKKGLLYFWPPSEITGGSAIVSLLDAPIISLDSCSNVTIRDIVFECSRGSGAVIRGGARNLLGGCTFRNLGATAVVLEGGISNGITGCDIYDLAMGGIILNAGQRKSLQPAGNYATNNSIHDFSHWLRTGQLGVVIDGVGNRIAHNAIYNAPFEAIYLKGNDHVIEYNDIHHVAQESGDAGAIHTGRDWTWRGSVIRYNYFHHLEGPGLHGVMGVYLDDWASGFTVTGNLFYKAGRATLIGGGRDNLVENNIYVECSPSIHIDARGLSWASYFFDGTERHLFNRLEEMNYREPPYSTHYPELLTLLQDQPALPKNNRILRNISFGGRWMDVYDCTTFPLSIVTIQGNVIADSILCRRRKPGETGWDPYYLNIDLKEGYVALTQHDMAITNELKGNLIMSTDPGFVDPARRDFHLKEKSPALQFGFRHIPLEEIGLITDSFRTRLDTRKE